LKWFPATRNMSDDDFEATLDLHATQAEHLKPITFMLIDVTEFFHSFADPDTLGWRDEYIIPRYNAAGVTKFAFQTQPDAAGTVESGAQPTIEGRANYPTAWFRTRERAYRWLSSPS
jgi:hypothetical protein